MSEYSPSHVFKWGWNRKNKPPETWKSLPTKCLPHATREGRLGRKSTINVGIGGTALGYKTALVINGITTKENSLSY
jgi:hypothetical protein